MSVTVKTSRKRKTTKTNRPTRKVVLSMPPVWSYSRWQTYELCPHKARRQYIDGYRFESDGNTAADRGTEIHKMAEACIKAKVLKEIPPILAPFSEDIHLMRKMKALAEVKLGLTRGWLPCDFDDPDYWWHGALDVVCMLKSTQCFISDWKSGKVRETHAIQLELYALVVFLHDPDIEEVLVEDWYVDAKKKSKTKRYLRRQVPALKALWERRVTPMFSDTTFAPCPNFLCNNYCEFAKNTGRGLCKFGGGD
jgi:hypothetical protein